jgi:threonine-phosphate decarboxylase
MLIFSCGDCVPRTLGQEFDVHKKHGGNLYQLARDRGVQPEALLDFSASINPLGYSPRLKKSPGWSDLSILNYPDHHAHEFISTLSGYHGLDRRCFCAGNGSTEFIHLLPGILRPKRVLIVAPAFTEYAQSYRHSRSALCYCISREKDHFAVNPKKLLTQLKRGYGALYICNPSTPAGVITPADTLCEIVSAAATHGTRVVLDETFIDFAEQHSLKSAVTTFGNLYILRSMTKFFALPGVRAGYLISRPDNIEHVRNRLPPWSTNALAQKAAAESLRDSAYIRTTRRYITAARAAFAAGLSAIACLKVFPGCANFLLIKLAASAPLRAPQLYDQLLAAGIIIRTCEDFEGLSESFFRVAVKTRRANNTLLREIKKILGSRPDTARIPRR